MNRIAAALAALMCVAGLPSARAQAVGTDEATLSRWAVNGFGTLGAAHHDEDDTRFRRSVDQRGGVREGHVEIRNDSVLGVQVNGGLRATTGAQIATLQQQLQATPQIQYVAVLADDKADASMLVTFDPKNNQLVLQRVGGFQEGADKSLQLWALPPGQGPRSLGVLGHDKLLKLVAQEGDVKEVPTLAISLEPLGGVPSATGPTGPVLFKGALIRKAT